jgi:hypothetical protein
MDNTGCLLTFAQHPPKMSEKLLTIGAMAAMTNDAFDRNSRLYILMM